MKKALLSISVLASMTASAAAFQHYMPVPVPVAKAHFIETTVQVPKAPQKIAHVDELVGEYICSTTPMDEESLAESNAVRIAKGSAPSTITMQGLFFSEDSSKITAVVDGGNNTFTIAPGQTVYHSATLGDYVMYKVTAYDPAEGAQVDKNANIEGTIEGDVLKITTPWAATLAQGEYAGFTFPPIHASDVLRRANGKMEYTNSKNKAVSTNVHITEQDDSIITVYNFGNFGINVIMTAKPDSTVIIPKQDVIFGGEEDGTFFTTDIIGEGDDAQIGDYNISCKVNPDNPKEITFTENWTLLSTQNFWFGICKDTKIYFTNDEEFKFPKMESNGVNNVADDKIAVKTTYVNLTGVESKEPLEGVNIVITRYTDGTTQAKKVLR